MSNKGYILSGLATDDVHHTSSVGKALTLIKAPKLDKKDILKAIENGCFYASKGPIIVDFFVDKNLKTSVKCSPFQKISFRINETGNGKVFNSKDSNGIIYAE